MNFRHRLHLPALVALVLLAGAASAAGAAGAADPAPAGGGGPAPAAESPPAQNSYAVVVSRKTYADRAWRPVVGTLQKKYAGRIVTWDATVRESQKELAARMPNYVCFVAPPEEAGRDFVVAVHRLTRRLDDDPYTDCLWGILTGYTADDALRIARLGQPLVLKKCLSGTSGGLLGPFVEGVAFNEGKAGGMAARTADGQVRQAGCPPDSTRAIADYFNREKPDCFITSGHATQHDWQIGYSFKGGQFRCRDGQLFALDTQGQRIDIISPNPKVYLPVGNCLIGDIPGRDCMVTALIHSAGVCQMFGYTVPTWYGKGGWGIQDYYLGQPGRWTLSEAFFCNTQAMLHELQARFPKNAGLDFAQYDLERSPRLLDELASKHAVSGRDELGLLWDRDTVAFYGDPAWQARPAGRKLAWDQSLAVKGNRYTFTVTANEDGKWPGRPVMMLLPQRLANIKIVSAPDAAPLVTENFILLPLNGNFKAGDKVEVVFEAAVPPRRPGID